MRISTTNLKAIVASVCLMTASAASAISQWECSLKLTAADAVFVTSKGTVLAADNDFHFAPTSGIHYSTDEGDTWTQADVMPYLYNYFFEAGDYVFALGESARIARSEDDGKTWIVLNYERCIEDLVEPSEMEYVTGYTASYDPELKRIYVPIYSSTVGVIYSDDFGVTWNLADRESLMLHFDDTDAIDTLYGSSFFNGKLYVHGIYFIYAYDPDADKWSFVLTPESKPYNSNFLCVLAQRDGVLYAARAMEDQDPEKAFVQYTTDMVHWEKFGHPSNILTNYVRSIVTDEEYLYAATINLGIYRTKDKGEHWEYIGDGMPLHPQYAPCFADRSVALALSENYLFVAQHDFFNATSGIYRVKRGEDMGIDADIVSIAEVAVEGPEVSVTADAIEAPGAMSIAVSSIAGAQLLDVAADYLPTSSLPAGVYVYVVKAADGAQSTGKFIKH